MTMQIIVANFDTKDGAKEALKALKQHKLTKGNMAVLSKNEKGKIRVKETHDWGGGKGAAAGAVAGAFIPVVGIIPGAIIGGIAAKLRDSGFPNDTLKEMANSLEPEHSMIVALVDDGAAGAVQDVLSSAGGNHLSHPVSADLAAELDVAAETGETEVEVSSDEEGEQN